MKQIKNEDSLVALKLRDAAIGYNPESGKKHTKTRKQISIYLYNLVSNYSNTTTKEFMEFVTDFFNDIFGIKYICKMYMAVSHHILYPILCQVFIHLNKIQYEINGSFCISSHIAMDDYYHCYCYYFLFVIQHPSSVSK